MMPSAIVPLLLAAGLAQSNPAPRTHSSVAEEAPVVIYRDPSRYTTFPDVERLPDGRLFCVFRDAKYPARVTHIDEDARVVGCTSADGGRTWSKPTVVYDDPACQQDPSVAVLRDGRIALNFFNWVGVSAAQLATQPSPSARKMYRSSPWGEYAELEGVYLLWGKADSLKWEERALHLRGTRQLMRATSSSMIETRRDVLLIPVYGSSGKVRKDEAFVLRSTDGGKSWQEIRIAADPGGKVQFQEPALVETGPGRILAVMRTAGADDHLYQVRSDDDGLTWSDPQRLAVVGHPADLMRLPDGRILLAYGYRHKPFGVRACVSTDEGRTWDLKREFYIADQGVQTDLGYPSVCLADDQHVLVAYYMNGPGTTDRWIECKRIAISDLP